MNHVHFETFTPSIEAGKLVEKIKCTDGYECVQKVNGKYEWRYANTEVETFDTFEELYESAEADAQAFTQDELNTWQIAPKLPPEQEAHARLLVDVYKADDDEALTALVKADLVRHMEITLFQGSIKNPRARKDIVADIARIRGAK